GCPPLRAIDPRFACFLLRDRARPELRAERAQRRRAVEAAEVVSLPAAAVVQDRLAAVRVPHGPEPPGDLGHRGVPVDLLERAVRATAQRMEHALAPSVLIVMEAKGLLTGIALRAGMRLVAPDLLETATVLTAELDQDAAVALAEDARRRFPVGSALGGDLGRHRLLQRLREYLLDIRQYTVYTMQSMARGAGTPKRRYQHFCPAARALETIGEKWSLLIVRDLLGGPRRFSDLRRSLAAITPKWLSARLRALEAEGIITRDVVG